MTTVEQELTLVPQFGPAPLETVEPPVAFKFDPKDPDATLIAVTLRHALESLPPDTELPIHQIETTRSHLEDCVAASIVAAGKMMIVTQVEELIEEQPWFADRPLPRTRIKGPLDEEGLERTMDALPPLPELVQAANETYQKVQNGEIQVEEPETGSEFYERVSAEVKDARKLRPFDVEEANVIKRSLYLRALDRGVEFAERLVVTHTLLNIERTDGEVLHVELS
jgi:hypothetical protein